MCLANEQQQLQGQFVKKKFNTMNQIRYQYDEI